MANCGCYRSGLVRSPLPTTVMQVSSRLLLVWGVVNTYTSVTAISPLYSIMLLAWSFTEVIRYSYFVLNLRGSVPSFVIWLRYNTFYVLYPAGILSEAVLIWKASGVARKEVQWGLWGILLAYLPGSWHSQPVKASWDDIELTLPGSYILYTHMMTQRRKIIRGKQPERRDRGLTQ